jgi:hypothetical protein
MERSGGLSDQLLDYIPTILRPTNFFSPQGCFIPTAFHTYRERRGLSPLSTLFLVLPITQGQNELLVIFIISSVNHNL